MPKLMKALWQVQTLSVLEVA